MIRRLALVLFLCCTMARAEWFPTNSSLGAYWQVISPVWATLYNEPLQVPINYTVKGGWVVEDVESGYGYTDTTNIVLTNQFWPWIWTNNPALIVTGYTYATKARLTNMDVKASAIIPFYAVSQQAKAGNNYDAFFAQQDIQRDPQGNITGTNYPSFFPIYLNRSALIYHELVGPYVNTGVYVDGQGQIQTYSQKLSPYQNEYGAYQHVETNIWKTFDSGFGMFIWGTNILRPMDVAQEFTYYAESNPVTGTTNSWIPRYNYYLFGKLGAYRGWYGRWILPMCDNLDFIWARYGTGTNAQRIAADQMPNGRRLMAQYLRRGTNTYANTMSFQFNLLDCLYWMWYRTDWGYKSEFPPPPSSTNPIVGYNMVLSTTNREVPGTATLVGPPIYPYVSASAQGFWIKTNSVYSGSGYFDPLRADNETNGYRLSNSNEYLLYGLYGTPANNHDQIVFRVQSRPLPFAYMGECRYNNIADPFETDGVRAEQWPDTDHHAALVARLRAYSQMKYLPIYENTKPLEGMPYWYWTNTYSCIVSQQVDGWYFSKYLPELEAQQNTNFFKMVGEPPVAVYIDYSNDVDYLGRFWEPDETHRYFESNVTAWTELPFTAEGIPIVNSNGEPASIIITTPSIVEGFQMTMARDPPQTIRDLGPVVTNFPPPGTDVPVGESGITTNNAPGELIFPWWDDCKDYYLPPLADYPMLDAMLTNQTPIASQPPNCNLGIGARVGIYQDATIEDLRHYSEPWPYDWRGDTYWADGAKGIADTFWVTGNIVMSSIQIDNLWTGTPHRAHVYVKGTYWNNDETMSTQQYKLLLATPWTYSNSLVITDIGKKMATNLPPLLFECNVDRQVQYVPVTTAWFRVTNAMPTYIVFPTNTDYAMTVYAVTQSVSSNTDMIIGWCGTNALYADSNDFYISMNYLCDTNLDPNQSYVIGYTNMAVWTNYGFSSFNPVTYRTNVWYQEYCSKTNFMPDPYGLAPEGVLVETNMVWSDCLSNYVPDSINVYHYTYQWPTNSLVNIGLSTPTANEPDTNVPTFLPGSNHMKSVTWTRNYEAVSTNFVWDLTPIVLIEWDFQQSDWKY